MQAARASIRLARTASLPLVIGLIAGVGLLGSCDVFGGPCSHTFEDPVLVIREVRDSKGGSVSAVTLSAIVLDGRPVSDLHLLVLFPGFNVRQVGDALECEVPCGLGTIEGTYGFVVGSTSGEAATVSVEAAYRDFDGGCPSSNSGPTDIAVVLSKAATIGRGY